MRLHVMKFFVEIKKLVSDLSEMSHITTVDFSTAKPKWKLISLKQEKKEGKNVKESDNTNIFTTFL